MRRPHAAMSVEPVTHSATAAPARPTVSSHTGRSLLHVHCCAAQVYGVIAMVLSVSVTFFDPLFGHPGLFFLSFLPGGLLGGLLAVGVQMTSMPQLVALLHSFVGIAAVLVGVANAVSDQVGAYNASPLLHKLEIYIGVFIGSVTVTGSLVAAGKLHEWLRSAPLILGGSSTARHVFNITILTLCALLGWLYCSSVESYSSGLYELLAMIALAGVLGWHLVMSIGGADMPVVVSMLNSYSGWATAASGFMLERYKKPPLTPVSQTGAATVWWLTDCLLPLLSSLMCCVSAICSLSPVLWLAAAAPSCRTSWSVRHCTPVCPFCCTVLVLSVSSRSV